MYPAFAAVVACELAEWALAGSPRPTGPHRLRHNHQLPGHELGDLARCGAPWLPWA